MFSKRTYDKVVSSTKPVPASCHLFGGQRLGRMRQSLVSEILFKTRVQIQDVGLVCHALKSV